MTLAEPGFPPLLNGRVVIKGDDPTALAVAGTIENRLGAGDTLWVQDTSDVHLAIVLEPDDPLAKAAQMLPLAVAAAGDSLASLTPPQVGVSFRWPGTLLLNGAKAGTCHLTAPADCQPSDIPKWLVLSYWLRFAFDDTTEPGSTPGITSLVEEGGEELSTIDVMESYARHFLSLLDTWQHEGFAEIADNWRTRSEGLGEPVMIDHPTNKTVARVLGLDEDGNLLAKLATGDGPAISFKLLDCIERAGGSSAPKSSPR